MHKSDFTNKLILIKNTYLSVGVLEGFSSHFLCCGDTADVLFGCFLVFSLYVFALFQHTFGWYAWPRPVRCHRALESSCCWLCCAATHHLPLIWKPHRLPFSVREPAYTTSVPFTVHFSPADLLLSFFMLVCHSLLSVLCFCLPRYVTEDSVTFIRVTPLYFSTSAALISITQ